MIAFVYTLKPVSYTHLDVYKRQARNLPLSRTMRPQWDAAVLLNIGFKKVMIEQDMGDRVWDDEEQVNYASTPMFMIAATK